MTEKEITKLNRKDKLMIAIIVSGGFITLLNQMVMSPALPTVMREFGITAGVGQWLTSVFLLVNGLMVPVAAFLIGRFTTRQLFITALLAFTAGSTVAAFANSFAMLLVARIMQAAGAGIMMPFAVVVIMLIFPKERRGFAMGLYGIVIGFAPAFGPTLAGWIVDEWGWRYIFALIAPLTAVVIIIAAFLLRNLGEQQKNKLDVLSVILSTLGFGGLLYGFSVAGSQGWLHPLTLAPIAAGAVIAILFVRRQLRLTEPMLNLRILRNPTFSVSTTLCAVVSAGLTVAAVLTPIFLQSVLGLSALQSGLMLMPGAFVMAGMSLVTGTLFDRFGPRGLSIAGLSIMTGGSVMLSLMNEQSSLVYICFAYTIRMLGMSMVNMPINTWGINALSNRMIAHGNAINNTARQVAGSMGTAVLVTVMMIVAGHDQNPGSAHATVAGMDMAFLCASGLTACALILSIMKVGSGGDHEE
jgi:EmrB/QacA subfamily drug resistance transporter